MIVIRDAGTLGYERGREDSGSTPPVAQFAAALDDTNPEISEGRIRRPVFPSGSGLAAR